MTYPPNHGGSTGGGQGSAESGGPAQPPEDPPRRGRLIGAIVLGLALLAFGAVLLVTLLTGEDEEDPIADPTTDTESPAEETETPTEEPTTEADDRFAGRCLPYEPQVDDRQVEVLASCEDDEAFWEITDWSEDVDTSVDDEGGLADNQPAYDLCGESSGVFELGEPWQDWYYVYDSATGGIDYLYCIEALETADEDGRIPVVPDEGDCFDDSNEWWSVPCDSDLALYEVVGTVEYDEPRELSDDEAAEEATCGGDLYWQVTDVEGRTSAILCGNEV
ncbi:hypothetical protein [Glycomyces xiaoerkulensis]|uniref:hypothetical protein n=1 Tax=Glycomyces xiaoerkulensis TaxID=2038139 RepID=UPI000C268737|nr:hypothetical protein [Glycomyces xiaoerkulensis]